jgi:hypothetical protein
VEVEAPKVAAVKKGRPAKAKAAAHATEWWILSQVGLHNFWSRQDSSTVKMH